MIGAIDRATARSAREDADALSVAGVAVAAAQMPRPGTLAHVLAQPSPLDRLVSGAGQLARFAAADPSPIATPGMTIRLNEILPDIAPRHAIGTATHVPPAPPAEGTGRIEADGRLAARVEAPATVAAPSPGALAPSARVEPAAGTGRAQASIIVTIMGRGPEPA